MEAKDEAIIIGRYLIGTKISNDAILLYQKGLTTQHISSNKKDIRIESFALKNPLFIGMIDGGLALTKTNSTLRKKIFLMLAILETFPEYADKFLPGKGGFFGFLWGGIRGVIRGIAGFILVKLI